MSSCTFMFTLSILNINPNPLKWIFYWPHKIYRIQTPLLFNYITPWQSSKNGDNFNSNINTIHSFFLIRHDKSPNHFYINFISKQNREHKSRTLIWAKYYYYDQSLRYLLSTSAAAIEAVCFHHTIHARTNLFIHKNYLFPIQKKSPFLSIINIAINTYPFRIIKDSRRVDYTHISAFYNIMHIPSSNSSKRSENLNIHFHE